MSTVNLNDKRAQIEVLKWAKARRKEIDDIERQARDIIENALGDNESGTVDGDLVVTWKAGKRRVLNQKALKESHPEIVEEFTETTVVRRFVVFE